MNNSPDASESGRPADYLAKLRDLTFRLLAEQNNPAKEILVGSLPELWPSDLPILEDSQIIGSQVPPSGELIVILGTDLPLDSVYDIYDTALHAAGWSPLQVDQPYGIREGFGASIRLHNFNYYKGEKEKGDEEQEQGLTLRVKANSLPDGSTEVRLYLEHGPAPDQGQNRRDYDQPPILPLLNGPAGAELTTAGGGVGERYRCSTAFMDTEMDRQNVADFYADQLVKAGWELNDQGTSGPITWTGWLFRSEQGESWEGTLMIVESRSRGPNDSSEYKRNYYLSINAQML